MGPKKRKMMVSKEPGNLKRFRQDMASFIGEDEDTNKLCDSQMTRKQKRKEQRQLTKMRKLAYRQGKELPTSDSLQKERDAKTAAEKKRQKRAMKRKRRRENQREKQEEEEKTAAAAHEDMEAANKQEDKVIKELEKQLGLKGRKSKSLPRGFLNDGLDFLLDAVDPEKLKAIYDGNEYEDDLKAPILGPDSEEEDEGFSDDENNDDMEEDLGSISDSNDETNIEVISENHGDSCKGIIKKTQTNKKDKKVMFEEDDESSIESPTKLQGKLGDIRKLVSDIKSDTSTSKSSRLDALAKLVADEVSQKPTTSLSEEKNVSAFNKPKGKLKTDSDESDANEDESESYEESDEEAELSDTSEGIESPVEEKESDLSDLDDDEDNELKSQVSELKEDIYGRLRDKAGNVIEGKAMPSVASSGRYVPPGKRLEQATTTDEKKRLELEKLKKQLKGLINRLSESNLQSISNQIEEMYRSHSRAYTSEALTDIILSACISTVLIPDRLIMEQTMLIAVLHNNIGSEVGATFLQDVAQQFHQLESQGGCYGDGKQMDNVLVLLGHLYNFKVVHSLLVFDIMKILVNRFEERDIELLLVVLKSVGFSLRKDDPEALKDMIIKIQTKAASVDISKFQDQSRVKFMLEILMAIRNNNMRKIPNYDPSHMEHLRKLLRNYCKRSSSADSQLRISLEDLLSSDQKGRWWLVGSAWTGRSTDSEETASSSTATSLGNQFSEKILELARKQRMNTDVRKNIFCIIMTCEDFVDAFEKLLRLGLKHQQEREIIHVIMDICGQEKAYNPFYAFLTEKFCEFHRRFQMTVQFSTWDRLKVMHEMTDKKITNLAIFMSHLIATKAISLSILKVVEFSELDKHKLLFIKTILTTLLMNYEDYIVQEAFHRIAVLPKLRHLRDGLKLFMQHFILRHKGKVVTVDETLKQKIQVAEEVLTAAESTHQL